MISEKVAVHRLHRLQLADEEFQHVQGQAGGVLQGQADIQGVSGMEIIIDEQVGVEEKKGSDDE